MALFSRTNTKAKKESPKKEVVASPATSSSAAHSYAHILSGPRITEKATSHQMSGVYTFDISESATKRDVIRAVHALYKVMPRMVRVARVPSKTKRNMRTGRVGISQGGRKAYVYLKSGDTITIA